ncbi:MAG TPA: hypothetical protein DCE78_02220 [Bacteroidetes bacterium]|nr:hypothetical protein [Bacteroidota bacterium]
MNGIPKNQIRLTVAICTYNRCAYLRDTLSDLAKQQYSDRDVEILVVNNNSTDGTVEFLSGYVHEGNLGFRWVSEARQGLSYARNRALSESGAQYVLYIDDDVFLDEDFIENWIQFIDANPTMTEAGGPISVHFDDGQPQWFPMVLKQMLGHHHPYDQDQNYRSGDYPHGGNMLFHRESALKLGGFNVDLGRSGTNLSGGEEKELNRRIIQSGGIVRYNAASGLRHRIGKDRLTKTYFKKQARGIGIGDRNSAISGTDAIRWMLLQSLKLSGSIIIAFGYLISLRPAAAKALIQFRLEVIKGYFSAE